MSHRYPPGPPNWSLGMAYLPAIRRDMIGFYQGLVQRYGDIVYMRLGPYRDYTIAHPELVREVLVAKAKSFRKMDWQRDVLGQWNGNSILLSEDDFWLRQRRLVQPAFHQKRFEGYAEVMAVCIQRQVKRWLAAASATGNTEVEMVQDMADLTATLIGQTMFGVDITGSARELGKAVAVLSDVAIYEMSHALRLRARFAPAYRSQKRWAMQVIDTAVRDFIRERRASGEDRGDLLSMLLLAADQEGDGGQMTDEQVRDEAVTLLLAGHDTTAAGLTWLWYLLAEHPEAAKRALEEIEAVIGDRVPTAVDLRNLHYTEMVLKEAMRLYPPAVGTFQRQAREDVAIGGYPIKKGGIVRVLSYLVHHDPRWFPDPERFDPERFAPGRVESIPQYAYFPFGGGPRVCIGNQFAMMEMTLVLALVLPRFQVALAPGQGKPELAVGMALRPQGGMRVRLTERTFAPLAGARA